MKKYLVLGGTGAMGSHLVSYLSRGGIVYVTSRSSRDNVHNVKYIKGNAHDICFIQKSLLNQCWDAIIDFMLYNTKEFSDRVDLFLSSTKQYIYLSSSRVYAESELPLRENSPRLLDVCEDRKYLSTDEYALAKARQEDILKRNSKNNWTIVRPYLTFSEQRIQLSQLEKEYWLYRALKNKTIVFSEDIISKVTTLTYGADVAKAIVSLIGEEEAFGEVFNVTGDENFKWSDILDLYLGVIEKSIGFRPRVYLMPKWEPLIGGGEYQIKYDRLYDRIFDNSKINQFTDTSKFLNTKDALRQCVSNFITSNLHFNEINWSSEARKDRITNDFSQVSEIDGIKNKFKYLLIRSGIHK